MNRIESEEKFLRQSYLDAWTNYQILLSGSNTINWNWIVVTASNHRQAKAYKKQIETRLENGMFPANTSFAVVPDIDGKRIGSGGATLNVIRHIVEKDGLDNLEKQKILVIHSGGDSRRIPQYSACGKLFSPIPRILPNGKCAALFDELLMSVSHIPARMSAGMLILPGDTELLFHPLQLDLLSCDAAGLSMKANILKGKEHGVFLAGDKQIVRRFLHKQPEDVLRKAGAVDAGDDVDIDTGCIWFGHKLVRKLADLFYADGILREKKFRQFVNDEVRLSFYVDFIVPLTGEITWEEYRDEKPEGPYSDSLLQCRKELWKILHPYKIILIRMAPARYIHIGTTEELFNLMVEDIGSYHYLGWKRKVACTIANPVNYSGINCYVAKTVQVNANCYIENSIILGNTMIESGTILSGICVKDMRIPPKIVLHGLKLRNGRYVCRIYGIEDNPKGSADSGFMESSLRELLKTADMEARQVWATHPFSIWNADIYVECTTCEKAVEMAIQLYQIVKGRASQREIDQWKMSKRYSLESSFAESDTDGFLHFEERIRNMVIAENCIDQIQKGQDVRQVMERFIQWNPQALNQIREFAENEKNLFLKIRLYLGLSVLCGRHHKKLDGYGSEEFENMAYEQMKQEVLHAVFLHHKKNNNLFFKNEEADAKLPIRVNFCGSPSDAAPYCLEHGGTMLDAALLLKGKKPVQVKVKKIKEPVIRFMSIDLGQETVYTKLCEIQNCGNPYDTFALHKAVLLACTVIPLHDNGISLRELCENMGGGLAMITQVNVPKGSGLGTSSILAAAAVRALHEIMGESVRNDQIYAEVFLAEQLMNTGGGWQDQAGGLTPGIKLMRSDPGIYQQIKIEPVSIRDEVKKELQDRFVLIFSGQRRLAKNILREEMNRCIENSRQSLKTVENIRKLCVLMKYELEQGNVTGFASYMTEQFELIKKLDKSASNACIEYIFECCEDLTDGKSVCGAGGGGFLQVILKKGIGKEVLRKRLQEVFKGCGVEVWDSTFLWSLEQSFGG